MRTLITSFLLFYCLSVTAQDKPVDFHLDKEYSISATGVIRLHSSDAKVTITGSSRTTAHVKIDRVVTTKGWKFGDERFSADVYEQSGDLVIKERSSGTSVGIVGYYHEKYTIQLAVPEGVSLVVKGDDGDYFISHVNGSIELELDDADVELTRCPGTYFKVKLDDGDLRMDSGKGTLELEADDADVQIKNAAFDKIIVDIDDGDFVVETALGNNGDYFIQAQDGLVSFTVLDGGGTFDIRHDDARVMTQGNFDMIEKSDSRTKLGLANGTAKVSIKADDARVRLIK
jgi:hypothetical protein